MCGRNVDMSIIKTLSTYTNLIVLGLAIYCTYRTSVIFGRLSDWNLLLQNSRLSEVPLQGMIMFILAIVLIAFGFLALFANGFGMLVYYFFLLAVHALICLCMGFYLHIKSQEYENSKYYQHVFLEFPNITQNFGIMTEMSNMQEILRMYIIIIFIECLGT